MVPGAIIVDDVSSVVLEPVFVLPDGRLLPLDNLLPDATSVESDEHYKHHYRLSFRVEYGGNLLQLSLGLLLQHLLGIYLALFGHQIYPLCGFFC